MIVEWKKGRINECGSMQDDGGWGGCGGPDAKFYIF
jgi:hypothetical protein